MKQLNKAATRTFKKIIERLNDSFSGFQQGDSCTIDKKDGAFTPLSVERLLTYDNGTVYTFCHYFIQNGDMCQDPEMLFLAHQSGRVYPMMFQQAIPPVYEESLFRENGKWKVNHRLQHQHTTFANMWLKNIKSQQKL